MILSIIFRLFVQLFAPRPTARLVGNKLTIQSGWRTWLFTLGGRHRVVTVDHSNRPVMIRDRRFWISTSSQMIAKERIVYVLNEVVDFGNMITSEIFTVGLFLDDGKIINLFRLYGEGEFVHNGFLPDMLFWEDTIPGQIVKNKQDDHSTAVCKMLANALQKPVRMSPY